MYLNPNIEGRVLAGEYQSIRLRGIREPVSSYLVEGMGADWQVIIDEQFKQVIDLENNEYHYLQAG
jgi:hypothetical protein